MVYNVCAKMTIFHKLDVIDVGVEVVPVRYTRPRFAHAIQRLHVLSGSLVAKALSRTRAAGGFAVIRRNARMRALPRVVCYASQSPSRHRHRIRY